jgi:hypothetical protein
VDVRRFGSQNRKSPSRKEKNLLPLPGIELLFLGRPARRHELQWLAYSRYVNEIHTYTTSMTRKKYFAKYQCRVCSEIILTLIIHWNKCAPIPLNNKLQETELSVATVASTPEVSTATTLILSMAGNGNIQIGMVSCRILFVPSPLKILKFGIYGCHKRTWKVTDQTGTLFLFYMINNISGKE